MLPSILLVIGVVGVFLGDPGRLAALSANLSATFPPLTSFFKEALAGFADGAVTYSVVGVVVLVWGASRFYQSLDDAMARIFESTRRRDPLQRGVFGILSVLLLGAGVGGVIAASHLVANLAADGIPGVALGASILSSTIGSGLVIVTVFSGGSRSCTASFRPPAGMADDRPAGDRRRYVHRDVHGALCGAHPPARGLPAGLRCVRGRIRRDDLAVIRQSGAPDRRRLGSPQGGPGRRAQGAESGSGGRVHVTTVHVTTEDPLCRPGRSPAERKISTRQEQQARTREFSGRRMANGAADRGSHIPWMSHVPQQGGSVVCDAPSHVAEGRRSSGREDHAASLGQGGEADDPAELGHGWHPIIPRGRT
ncbi:MAG: YihY/virulence factor BrkB family protein [Chloroflexi bacterium]|nr:YihY/virulence factor BrkB family protein [Chloroflexota bacterium]